MAEIHISNVPSEVVWQLERISTFVVAGTLPVYAGLLFDQIRDKENLLEGFSDWKAVAKGLSAIIWSGYFITPTEAIPITDANPSLVQEALKIGVGLVKLPAS